MTAASDRPGFPKGLTDTLDYLTAVHAEMMERHGPLLGEASPRPLEPVPFAGEQARTGLALDQAPAEAKAALLIELEAQQHEQVSRLAFHVAGYEVAHGDPGHAPDMRELARDHAALAKGLRDQIVNQPNGDRMASFVSDEVREQYKREARQHSVDRDL